MSRQVFQSQGVKLSSQSCACAIACKSSMKMPAGAPEASVKILGGDSYRPICKGCAAMAVGMPSISIVASKKAVRGLSNSVSSVATRS